MAATISLTYGSTTVDLTSTTILTLAHPFGTPSVISSEVEVGRDKQNLSIAGYANVTESLDLLITGASVSALVTTIRSIESMLDKARQSARTWQDVRVYLEIEHEGDGSVAWRSEVLAGQLSYKEALDQLSRLKVEARLAITRRPFFEGARTALELSTAADTTPSTSERTLHITDTSVVGERNYINIAAAQVTGNLPTPIELQIRNAEAAAKTWTAYYIGNFVHMTPASVTPIFIGTDSLVDGASYTWTGTDTEQPTHRWEVTSAQLAYYAGQYVRMIARITSSNAVYARAVVEYYVAAAPPGVPIYKAGRQVFIGDSGTYDLGVVPLPPGGASASWSGVAIAIYGQYTGGSTLTIDHIQLMPAGDGKFRKIKQSGFTVANTTAMVDDGPEGLTYLRTVSTGARFPLLSGYYEPILLWPGVVNRLRIWIAGATKGDEVEAQAWYRPRRVSV